MIIWMQWKNKKHRKVTAHAVDTETCMNTGVRRALNGSLIPEDAVEWDGVAEKDPFSLSILNREPKRKKKKEKATPPEEPKDGLYRDGAEIRVFRQGVELARFDEKKLEPDTSTELRVTEKSWAVYQVGKRKAFGRL